MISTLQSTNPIRWILWTLVVAILAPGISRLSAAEPDLVLGDFEGMDFGAWKTEGEAFGAGPLHGVAAKSLAGFVGAGVAAALAGRGGTTGTLWSPTFKIERDYLNFLTWGTRTLPAQVGVEVLIDGRPVRSISSTDAFDRTGTLRARTCDLRAFAGRTAQIRVNVQSPSGVLAVDQFVQSDRPSSLPADATSLFHETLRPQFHYSAESGYENDANGMFYYRAVWHLFHQHREAGGMTFSWAHAVSEDLLHWKHWPTAVPPEGTDHIFSGTAAVDWGNTTGLQRGEDPPILLFYTVHPPARGTGRKSTQNFSFSTDGGRTFERYSGNPVLRTPAFNDRDPKVFYYQPTHSWYLVLSLSRNDTDREHATFGLFRSRDVRSWELFQEVGPGRWYWEGPDLFQLPLDGNPQRLKWLLMRSSGDYIVGSFDGHAFKPETPIQPQVRGAYYGAGTFSDAPGGRRVQIAWMNSEPAMKTGAGGVHLERLNHYPGMPFNQQMSFPRELSLRSTPDGPRIFANPIAEIKQLYIRTQEVTPGPLAPGDDALAGIDGELDDIELEIEPDAARQIVLDFRGEKVRWESSGLKLLIGDHEIPLAPQDGCLSLRILLDRTSIELYANGGATNAAWVFFPEADNRRLGLTATGGAARIRRLVVHELKSIWPRDQ